MNNPFEVIDARLSTIEELLIELKHGPTRVEKTNRQKLNGIRGIAKYLKCSVRTAQALKDKGLFPVYWVGKNLYAYSDEVEEGLKEKTARSNHSK
ncbi:DUF3853 family protein [Prolixibacter denitrificans]|uniref:Uncharacterized protein DUF3853 n=1 Tax=Prolixibacter denitrificans TaxID=1541063 RepID=A0A2P8CJW5_9BACT|nr:DUF3853 family protein [Prolixibacter denitrificans]PSK85251.1 uncharacterized protein DUF3853 [Prolixibacter denitrificans]GET19873.1 hypothetical protein JCM18694_01190 [Prolixibacter denitrificans]